MPAPQVEQTRFIVAVPAVLAYWPAEQLDHVVQLGALVAVLYEPSAQALHSRLAVLVPAEVTN